MKAQQIVLGPLVTERSMQMRDDENKYAFRVHPRATKPEIRKAIEELGIPGAVLMENAGRGAAAAPDRRDLGRRRAHRVLLGVA